MTTIRAAIYGRKSTEDERSGEDGRSVDRQVTLARAFARKHGWAVVEPYVVTDEARSGADFTRPGLVKILTAAEKKAFDVLVVMSIDRIGRDLFRMGVVFQRLHSAGVQVWTYSDARRIEFGTPIEKLMVGIGGFAAEEYRHAIKLKVTEAMRAKAARGHAVSGRTFGYDTKRVGDHTERVINDQQAKVVRKIFELSASGHGDMRIVAALSRDKVPVPGRGWSSMMVKRILKNELYVGRQVYGRTQNRDDGGRGKRVRMPETEWVVSELPQLRIVSDALWKKVQARKEKTKQHYAKGGGSSEPGLVATKLLNGFLKCGICGTSMTHMGNKARGDDGAVIVFGGKKFVPPPGSGGGGRYYCLGRNRRGPDACSLAHGVPMDLIDESVVDTIQRLLMREPEKMIALCKERDERLRALYVEQDRAGQLKEIAELETQIKRLVAAIATGKSSPDIADAISEKRTRIEALRVAVAEPPAFDTRRMEEGLNSLVLHPRRTKETRQVLRRLGVDKIVVRQDKRGQWSWESSLDPRRVYIESPEPPVLW